MNTLGIHYVINQISPFSSLGELKMIFLENLRLDIFWKKYDPVFSHASYKPCDAMPFLHSKEHFIELLDTVVNGVCDHFPHTMRKCVRINHPA